MKKLLFFLALLSLFSLKVKGETYKFVWEEGTTNIKVPLFANIQNYLDIPKAKLYCDDVELVDAEISYITTGDWLYLLTDVDTSKVGKYLVWFKATERKYQPGQCNGYKTLVTFHVEDLEEPKILVCPDKIEYKIGDVKPDYLLEVEAIDNSGNCDISVTDNVNYEKVGKYNVVIKISDGVNFVTKTILVSVIDDVGPKISFSGENNHVVVSIGEQLDLISYFKAIDLVDGDVTSSIKYDDIDTSTEGEYKVRVYFSDTQGNDNYYDIKVVVIDDNIPEIILASKNLMLDYNVNFEEYDFRANIYQAFDGKKNIIDLVSIDISNLQNKVGVYSIFYYYQKKEDIIKVECKVNVLANESPIVNTQDIEINSGEVPNYDDFISVEDPSDNQISNSIEVDDSNVDYSTPGVYPVYVTATNSSGLVTTEVFYVTVNEKSEEFDWKMVVIIVMLGYLVVSKVLTIIKRRN